MHDLDRQIQTKYIKTPILFAQVFHWQILFVRKLMGPTGVHETVRGNNRRTAENFITFNIYRKYVEICRYFPDDIYQ